MSVYKKLSEAREAFHRIELRKTGHNKFAGYNYFELGDFLVPAMKVMRESGLVTVTTFGKEMAVMRVIDIDKPDMFIEFSSPMASANLKGAHEIQNLGAVETYTRRYLWVMALEIVEHDALDASEPLKEDKTKPTKISPVPDVDLTDDQKEFVEQFRHEIVQEWLAGNELGVIDMWYRTEIDNDVRTAVWKALAQESKLRAFIKANKPESKAA